MNDSPNCPGCGSPSEFTTENYTRWKCQTMKADGKTAESHACLDAQLLKTTGENERLQSEIADLKRWKEDSLAVENQWDVQAVGNEIGLSLGKHIRQAILPFIKSLKQRLADAEDLLRDIRDGQVNSEDEADKFLRDHKPSCYAKLERRLAESEATAGKLREVLEMCQNTAVAMADAVRMKLRDSVIISEGPLRIRDAASAALNPPAGKESP